MEHPITDEHGRVWVLDLSTENMKDLINEYARLHGRPSRAVQAAFSRHGRVATLRLLVYRGVHGERINLAARALALGQFPDPTHPVAGRTGRSEQDRAAMQASLEQAQARQDTETLAALQVEAADFRARGYVD